MKPRQAIQQTNTWGPDGHPAAGHAQRRRTTKPMDRSTFLRNSLKVEFAKVAARNGIPARHCDREDMVILDILAQQLRVYCWAAYLIKPGIMSGMTLGDALDETTKVLADELNRRRLERVLAEAARA